MELASICVSILAGFAVALPLAAIGYCLDKFFEIFGGAIAEAIEESQLPPYIPESERKGYGWDEINEARRKKEEVK